MSEMKKVFSVPNSIHGQSSIYFCWQKKLGNYLATTSFDNIVRIYDRHGDLLQDPSLPGMCSGLGWDKDGDNLAMISDKSGIIFLWSTNSSKIQQIDSGFRDTLTVLSWAKNSHLLGIGTQKGNLLIYNPTTSKKIPILGKHTRSITCGCWSRENLLALGSDDKTITVSNTEGDTIHQTSLRASPTDIQFSEMKLNERSATGDNTISCIVGKKSLLLLNMDDPENPVELAFQGRYGQIVEYKWYGDGYILIGFSNGFIISISTHSSEIGQELFQARNHKDQLTCLTVSYVTLKAASGGDNVVKVYEMTDMKEISAIINLEERPDSINWTDDGQLLAVSTVKGNLNVYLSKLPQLGAAYQTRLAYLTSLLEVTVQDDVNQDGSQLLNVDIEPSFLGIGPFHVAVGMNNRAWFYIMADSGPEKVRDREYLGTVQVCKLNADYCAVRFENRVQLHVIEEEGNNPERESRLFPENESDCKVTCHDLTPEFLIFATNTGGIFYFYLEDWQYVNEFKHITGITYLTSDPYGTRLVFIDDKADAFVYNPVNDEQVAVPQFSAKTTGILWDQWQLDKGVFVSWDEEFIYTYLYSRDSIKGPDCKLIGTTKLPFGHIPLLLVNGDIYLHTTSGKVITSTLDTHVSEDEVQTEEQKIEAMRKCIQLGRYKSAITYATSLDKKEFWKEIGDHCLTYLDVETATRAFRQMGDVGMVLSLEDIKGIDDKNLLSGYISMYLNEFDMAQELFINSEKPSAALEMRRDLMHWDAALQLAKALAPDQIPYISKEYAQQLEFTGDYMNALSHYEKGIIKDSSLREHNEQCAAGIARMSIRMGDIRRGVGMAAKMPSRVLKKDCAAILESMKQWSEAAVLYEKGGFFDKAASVYIRSKNWTKVGELLPNVTSPKIHGQYARAKEAEGRYKEAVQAYTTAKEWDDVIRLQLDHLHNPEEAVRIVRHSQSTDGAKMVANFFQKLNDYGSAIQFLVISRHNDEAFQLAQAHDKMEVYADIIGEDATPQDYQSIALFFENRKNHFLAGKFFLYAGQYQRALKHLLSCNETKDGAPINLAIDVIGRAQDEQLTRQLIDFLMGDLDGEPKDAKYLFRLYMALNQFEEAARTAIIIAREEQIGGNYKNAHDVLFSMYQELKKNKIKIPAEMANNLMILHSYILVRIHVKKGDHLKGARLLIRVANNISKFPSHVVPILTSTVIECQRSGLKNSAFSYAAMLYRPEYRDKIDVKYKKKIEGIVRKSDKTEEDETTSSCPFCEFQLPDMELMCPECKNTIPYCIISGKHLIKSDLCACPVCDFPAIETEFRSILEMEDRCPMCSEPVLAENLRKVTEHDKYLNRNLDS
ncbi:DgyrCDS12539 [Dimorphilus gyrociliatus]|uniref:WD repeat-containing protein 19 n=1 Tax=Dimorphilus gyrociliatus TaxID=2664684 RepID=A0A7I8W6T3_9ANNE|nr:DgyrCDS12539 [Dimorphilus gyrociliatus]